MRSCTQASAEWKFVPLKSQPALPCINFFNLELMDYLFTLSIFTCLSSNQEREMPSSLQKVKVSQVCIHMYSSYKRVPGLTCPHGLRGTTSGPHCAGDKSRHILNTEAAPSMAQVRPSIGARSVEFPCHMKPQRGQEADVLTEDQCRTFRCLLSGFDTGGMMQSS